VAWHKRALEAFVVCMLFPIALLLLLGSVIAVGVQALLIYVGALLAAWLFTAIGLPMVTGAMAPGELLDAFRSRRRSETLYEGEPLPDRPSRRAVALGEILDSFRSRRSERLYEGEPLPDRALGYPLPKTFDAE
jgi:hypothetical protein